MALEAAEEHHVADLLLKELASTSKDKEEWLARLCALKEAVMPAMRGRGALPRDLVTAELLGALRGVPGYWRDRRRARGK